MDKVLKFLERHVQWLALALAFLYLGYMAYSYIVQAPLTLTMPMPDERNPRGGPPTALKPDQIDVAMVKGHVAALNRDYRNTDPVATPVQRDITSEFARKLNEENVQVATMHAWPGGMVGGAVASVPTVPGLPPIDKVLADLPAPHYDKSTTSRTVIAGRDVAYWTGRFTISAAALREVFKEYTKRATPDQLVVELAEVKLLRQEQLANGQWSAAIEIAAPPINAIMAVPADALTPTEKDAEQHKQLLLFRDWMEKHQDIIRQPAFFLTDPEAPRYVPPGTAIPEPAAAGPAAGPAPVAPSNLDSRVFDPARDQPRTEDERRQKKAFWDARRGSKGPALTPGPRGGMGATPRPPVAPSPSPSPSLTPPTTPRSAPPAAVHQPPVQPNVAGAAAGPVNLASLNDITLIGHDVTIEEGKHYRYSMRYKLYNPLYGVTGVAVPAVSNTYAVESPDPTAPPQVTVAAVWSPDATVEPSMHVFVNAITNNRTSAQFTIFYWKDGRWNMATTPDLKNGAGVTPGDALNANKIPTPWSLVDIRYDAHGKDSYVILMDGHGLQRHDVKGDAENVDFAKLKAQASPAAAAK